MKLKGIVIGFDTNKTKENISSKRNPPFSPPKIPRQTIAIKIHDRLVPLPAKNEKNLN